MAWAGISPSRLEVNLGPFPVDGYPSHPSSGVFPACPVQYTTVSACIQWFFNNNPANGTVNPENYVAQGVTGVRFQFALFGGGGTAGGGSSTPWDSHGNVQTAWTTSLVE